MVDAAGNVHFHPSPALAKAGLVTSAKLTVADLKPGAQYIVYANLNQVTAQLTDGNRNPMDWTIRRPR